MPRRPFRWDKYICKSRGGIAGFIGEKYVHCVRGRAIVRLDGAHFHKIAGPYVDELFKVIVVNTHLGNPGGIGNPGNPANPERPGNSRNSRSLSPECLGGFELLFG